MDTFEDLMSIDDKTMQSILHELSDYDVMLALKGASPAMQDKVVRNMTKQAGELCKNKACTVGAVPVEAVEKAQQQFLRVYNGIYDTVMQGI